MAKTAPRPFGKPRQHSLSKIWLCLTDSVSRPPTLSLEPDGQRLTCHTVSTATGHSSNSDTHFSWHCLMSAGGRWVLTLVKCCPNRRQSRGQQAWQQLSCNIAFLQSMCHCSQKNNSESSLLSVHEFLPSDWHRETKCGFFLSLTVLRWSLKTVRPTVSLFIRIFSDQGRLKKQKKHFYGVKRDKITAHLQQARIEFHSLRGKGPSTTPMLKMRFVVRRWISITASLLLAEVTTYITTPLWQS